MAIKQSMTEKLLPTQLPKILGTRADFKRTLYSTMPVSCMTPESNRKPELLEPVSDYAAGMLRPATGSSPCPSWRRKGSANYSGHKSPHRKVINSKPPVVLSGSRRRAANPLNHILQICIWGECTAIGDIWKLLHCVFGQLTQVLLSKLTFLPSDSH